MNPMEEPTPRRVTRENRLRRWCVLRREGHTGGAWAIIRWWEIRRFLYNGIVGITGLLTSGVLLLTARYAEETIGEPLGFPDPPLFAVLVAFLYGIAANGCYTGGWIAEWTSIRILKKDTSAWAPRIWLLGTAFSVVLTLLPVVMVVPMALLRIHHLRPH